MAVKTLYSTMFFWSLLIILEATYSTNLIQEQLQDNRDDSYSASQNDYDKRDCQVHKKHKINNWSGEPIRFLVYMEDLGSIACSLHYHGENSRLVHDKLILSQKGNEIHEFRNGNVNSTSLDTFVDVSGWTQIEISITNQQLIMKYWDVKSLNYTVNLSGKDIIIHGSNITMCEEKTPTWFVEEGVSAKIPIEPSWQVDNPAFKRTYILTLLSDNEISPCIGVGENRKCLGQEDSNIRLSTPSKPPSMITGRLELYLEVAPGFIHVYRKIEGKREEIASFPKLGMKSIKITSHNSNFSVSLNIFGQSQSSELTGVSIRDVQMYESVTSESSLNQDLLYGILIGVASACSVFGILVIGYVFRKKIFPSCFKDKKKVDASSESLVNHS